MKYLLLLVVLLHVVVKSAMAENNPYRTDVVWVTIPNHADWLYKCGENAEVEVTFLKYGKPTDVEVTYTVGTDMLEADTKGSVKLKNGRATIKIGTMRKPGFRDCVLTAIADGKEYTYHVKVGYNVDDIKPYTQKPRDFEQFWTEKLAEAEKYPLKYTMEDAPELCTEQIEAKLVRISLDNKGTCVYAYLIYPRDAKKGEHAVVLCPPGAGVKTIKEPLARKYYAENGFVRLEMEIHGLDPRMTTEQFKEISQALSYKENGYLCNGLDDKETFYMKKVYLACSRAIDFLTSLDMYDGEHCYVQGGSQGGALAIVTAALNKKVKACVVNHPALSDMAGYKVGTGGYPHYNKMRNMMTDDKVKTMAYYDVVNFARILTCPVRMTWGYNDNTCPPTTSYAVKNVIPTKVDCLITPINEHWTSVDTEKSHMEWLKQMWEGRVEKGR